MSEAFKTLDVSPFTCPTGVLKENLKVLVRREMPVFNLLEYFSTWNVHSECPSLFI